MKDERLVLQSLKNIRIAFAFQTICIVGMLIYDGIRKGISHITDSPLWLIFMATCVLLGYLNIRISVDVQQTFNSKKPGPYYKTLLLSLAVGVVFGGITFIGPDGTLRDALLIGGVLFICFLASFSYAYYLRRKHYEEMDEDESI
ncbi:hypothetical protein [Neobacillus dielmonensis]|uniref:hypothetical protein n=1 Tax=Neobacillus dielmonensis TaxID=1347369 RepID=UPI0005A5FC46|nr:hypothetical protein [Neobacillus dielmonensis]